jgi:hypothetical protein
MAAKPTPKPKAKPKGLNDFLKEGKTPPSKNKKLPSDADVTLKGYNDKKTIAKEKLKADMKSGKMKRVESGMTGAMVAKAAGKVVSKVAPKAASKLTDAEKYAVKFVKGIKPGEVQKTLDRLPKKLKAEISQALRKSGGDRSAVYKPTKQANPMYQKAQTKSGKIVKFDSAGNVIKKTK